MITIHKDSGKRVLNFIEKELHQELPKNGIIAGQSVTSVLLYILGKSKTISINDYDIFYPSHKKRSSWNFSPSTFTSANKEALFYVERHNASISMANALVVQHERRIMEASKTINPVEDEYSNEFCKPYTGNLYRKKNVLICSENVSKDSYKIEQVFRKGLLNYVFVSAKTIDWNTPHPMVVINSFDINCTQVAINLATGEIFYTHQFLQFINSMQMIVLRTNRPDHTFIRYMQKKELHGYYGNDEYAADVCLTYKSLYDEKYMEKLNDMEIQYQNHPAPNKQYERGISEFGTGYIDKYRISNGIKDYASLETRDVEIRKKIVEESDSIRSALLSIRGIHEQKPTYQLGKLNFRSAPSEFIISGQHRNDLTKALKIDIRGYIHYARANVSNILMQNYGIGKSKAHNKRCQILLEGKINTRTNFGHQESAIINNDYSYLSGTSTLEQRKATSELIKRHRSLRYNYVGLNQVESQKLTKILLTMEKKNPELLYMIEFNKTFKWKDLTREEMFDELNKDYVIYQEKLNKMNRLKEKPDFDTVIMDGYEIVELTTQGQLNDESKVLRHCVKIYGRRIRSLNSFIISFRKKNQSDVRYTLELKEDVDGTFFEVQFRGKHNSSAPAYVKIIKDKWLAEINDFIRKENERRLAENAKKSA